MPLRHEAERHVPLSLSLTAVAAGRLGALHQAATLLRQLAQTVLRGYQLLFGRTP